MDIALPYKRSRIHPLKFGLWLALAGIGMMFVGLTSAYVVRQAAGNWLEFQLPGIFYLSTALILCSSMTLELSYRNYVGGNGRMYKGMLLLSVLLGFGFLISQWTGWQALMDIGIDLKGNPSGSFVYVISGTHAAHILGGIATLMVALIHAFSLPYFRSPERKLRFELVLTYWHFVDVLWVYLLIFFLITR